MLRPRNLILFSLLYFFIRFINSDVKVAKTIHACSGTDVRLPCSPDLSNSKVGAVWWNIMTDPLVVLVQYILRIDKSIYRSNKAKYHLDKKDYSLSIKNVSMGDGTFLYVCRSTQGHYYAVNLTVERCQEKILPILEDIIIPQHRCGSICVSMFVLAIVFCIAMFVFAPLAKKHKFSGGKGDYFRMYFAMYLTCAFLSIGLCCLEVSVFYGVDPPLGKAIIAIPLIIDILHVLIMVPLICLWPGQAPTKNHKEGKYDGRYSLDGARESSDLSSREHWEKSP